MLIDRAMLEVGYLHIDSPIAVISPHSHPETGVATGLVLLDGFDLDDISLQKMRSALTAIAKAKEAIQRQLLWAFAPPAPETSRCWRRPSWPAATSVFWI